MSLHVSSLQVSLKEAGRQLLTGQGTWLQGGHDLHHVPLLCEGLRG